MGFNMNFSQMLVMSLFCGLVSFSNFCEAKKDYYKVLGLEKGASPAEIKKAYRKAALKLHPDKNTAPRADEAFKVVGKAFSVLTDDDKKSAYERYGADGPQVEHHHRGPRRG